MTGVYLWDHTGLLGSVRHREITVCLCVGGCGEWNPLGGAWNFSRSCAVGVSAVSTVVSRDKHWLLTCWPYKALRACQFPEVQHSC